MIVRVTETNKHFSRPLAAKGLEITAPDDVDRLLNYKKGII